MKSRAVFWICVSTVFVASVFGSRADGSGTAQWMFTQLMGGMVAGLIAGISGVELGALIDRPLAIAVNVAGFVLLNRVWRKNAPSRWYVAGVLALTVLYLASYFFFFPVRDTP